MIFSILALKFINWIIGFLPDSVFEDIPLLETTSDVMNIFSWVNFFLPTDLIFILLGITAAWYGVKLFIYIFNLTKDILF